MAYTVLPDATQQAAPCQQRHLLGHSLCLLVFLWLTCRGCCCLLKMPIWPIDNGCPQCSILVWGGIVAGAVWGRAWPCPSPGGQDPLNRRVAVCRCTVLSEGVQLVKGLKGKGSTPVAWDATVLAGTVSGCVASPSGPCMDSRMRERD